MHKAIARGLILAALSIAAPAFAQTPDPAEAAQTPDPAEAARGFGGPDQVQNRIQSDRTAEGALFNLDFLEPYDAWKERVYEKTGYTFGAVYVPVFLTANDTLPGTDQVESSGVFRFMGFWELLGRGTEDTGSLIYLLENRHLYTDQAPNAFSIDNLGNVGAIAIPFDDDGWHLTNLYWTQSWKKKRFEAVAGFLDVTDFVDVWLLTSPWTDFFNFAFSIGAATMDLPDDAALGIAAGAWITDSIYAIAGFEDLNSVPSRPWDGFETFFGDAEFFKHVEIGWSPSRERFYIDNLHLTFWHAAEREDLGVQDGWGLLLSFTHSIREKWLLFARGGYSKDGGSLLEASVSAGFGYQPNFVAIGAGDQFGFGFNWGRPNDALFGSGLDDQYAIEAYYRLQVTKELAITPDVQLIVNPALNPERDALFVFGLRARLAL